MGPIAGGLVFIYQAFKPALALWNEKRDHGSAHSKYLFILSKYGKSYPVHRQDNSLTNLGREYPKNMDITVAFFFKETQA